MTLSIPYSFTAGTTARSQEVNADFNAVQTEVNTLELELDTAKTNISTLQNGKANVNGSASNTFSVADPINNADSVNKRYFSSLTQYLIAGLIISKADSEYIACTTGACYDSTSAKILRFAEDVSTSDTPYNASATYYVYIIGTSAGGTNTRLLISPNSDSPSLPSGYVYYRGLGYFITNSSGEIDKVYSYGYVNGASVYNSSFISEVVNSSMPDYSSIQGKAWNTRYTAATPGYVHVQTVNIDDRGQHILNVSYNGSGWHWFASGGNTTATEWFRYNIFAAIPKGAEWYVEGDSYGTSVYWIPCIGGN